MSILDQQCRAGVGVLFADIGSGGGGGSNFNVASISSLTVSSINGAAPGGGGGTNPVVSTLTVSSMTSGGPQVIDIGGGGISVEDKVITDTGYMSTFNVSSILGSDVGGLTIGGDAVFFNPSIGVFFPSTGNLNFQDNKGVLTGISSINGGAYPPVAPVLPSTSVTVNPLQTYTYVPPGGATESVATITNLVSGNWYEIKGLFRYSLVGGGVPGPQDSIGFTLSGNLDTWANNNTVGCANISTLQNDVYQNFCIVAKANNNNAAALRAYGSPPSFAVSTSVGCEVPIVVTNLGSF